MLGRSVFSFARAAGAAAALFALTLTLGAVPGHSNGGTASPADPQATFVLPHILERQGHPVDDPLAIDTQIRLTYVGRSSDGVTIGLWLFDEGGTPMVARNGQPACGPCTFALGGDAPRKRSIVVEDLFAAGGGMPDSDIVVDGFAVVSASGEDRRNVLVSSEVVSAYFNPKELTIEKTGRWVTGSDSAGTPRRTFVLPHVLERDGSVPAPGDPTPPAEDAADTMIFATYAGGLAGIEAARETMWLELTLFEDQTGEPLRSATGEDVCNPCSFTLDATQRKRLIRMDDLIQRAGGAAGRVVLGFGVIVVSGDPDGVNLQGFVVNSHTSAFDLSVFTFEPQPIAAEAA